MHPLLLTGPPAVGKSTTANALARSRPRAAVIDVDDIRHLVVSGHAAPWHGSEGRLQQRIGVENACDLTQRLHFVGVDVVLADVVNADTLSIYRQRLPDLVIVKLRLPPAAARRRASSRPVHLTDQEFEDLHAADERTDPLVDAIVDVEHLTLEAQTTALMQMWLSRSGARP